MSDKREEDKSFSSRLVDYTIAFISLLLVNFFLPRCIPGDPVTALYGEEVVMGLSQEERDGLLEELGAKKPLLTQLMSYLTDLLWLDLGFSYHYQMPVSRVILQFAPWTLLLVGTILSLSVVSGFILGMESSWRHGQYKDTLILMVMMVFNALPPFALGMFILMISGYHLALFPISGATEPFTTATGFPLIADIIHHMAMPVLTMFLHDITQVYLLSRGTAITVRSKPFILVGKSKGLSSYTLKYRYMGRNALAPVLSRMGVMAANALTGIMFVEVIFAYPGLGTLTVESVMNHDYPVVQGVFLFIAVIVFSLNIAVDAMVNILTRRG